AGGGSYGAVQVGMLRALCAHDIRPDLVAGSSVGAINGAFYAGMPSANGIERLEALWRGLRRHDVFPIALSGLFGALVNSNHLFKPNGLRRLLTAHLPYSELEGSAIPVHVMATDLLTGSSVRLSAGPAVAAILASCAIPAIYPPVQIDDRTLIDGAVACNTPIRAAIELGATRLIILPTSFACPHAAPPRGIFASAFHAMDLFVMQQLDQDTKLYAKDAEIVMVPPICPLAVPPYDFSSIGRMIDLAARSTGCWLEDNGLSGGEALPTTNERSCARAGVETVPAGLHEDCVANLPSCVV
ncbi:MAG: patatin-like phospholipase family protein, partial [Woeseiaceae bacterium]